MQIDQLNAIVDLVFHERLEPLFSNYSTLLPNKDVRLGVSVVLKDGKPFLLQNDLLDGPKFQKSTAVAKYVDRVLRNKAIVASVVMHESWMSPAAGADMEVFNRRFGHLKPGPNGKAEVIIQVIHTPDFQTAVIHGIENRDGRRVLVKGTPDYEGLTLGGMMTREMPVRH